MFGGGRTVLRETGNKIVLKFSVHIICLSTKKKSLCLILKNISLASSAPALNRQQCTLSGMGLLH